MAQFLQTQGMSKKPTSYLDVLKQKEQEKKKINLFDFSDVKPTQSTQTPQINFGQPVSQRNVTNFTDYQSTLPKQQPTTQKSSGFSIIPTAKASDGKMSLQEFGDMIKKKYPDYNEIDSNELGRKMLEKFPDYNDVVDINIQPQPQDFSAEQNLIKNLGERYKQFTTAKDEGPLRTLTKGALPFDLQKTGALGKAFGDILGYGLEKSLSPEMKKTIVDTIGEDNLKKLDKLGQIIKSQEQTIKKVPGGAEAIDIGKNVLATSDLIGTGIAGKGLVTGGAKVLTKGGKVLSKGVGKITPDLQKTASTVSTKANRFNAVDEEKFIKTTGQTPGEFAVERGMTEVGDKAVEKATQNYLTSIKQADDAFENVGGNFKYTGKGNDPIKLSIDDLETRGIKTEADYTPRIQELKAKYETEGLTMPEINEIKREYARNFKYGFEDRNSEALARSTNIQNRLREWQLNKADEMGVSNIRDINKNTQAWKLYADALEKKLNRSGANNAVGITDWIALSGGNPTNVALFLGKKLGTSDKAKELLIKTLGKKTKGAIITPDINKPQIKGLLPKGPVITPAPKFKSGIKVTPATIQPNVKTQKALPPGKVVTPQTIEKGIIQESKITLKNTKYGTNNNISSNMNNTRTDKLLKPNQPTNVSNKPLQKTTKTGRELLKKILPSNFKEKVQDFVEGVADKVGARTKLLPTNSKQVSINPIKDDLDLINKFNTYQDLDNYADLNFGKSSTLRSRIQGIAKGGDKENLLSNLGPNTIKRVIQDNPSLGGKIPKEITIYRTGDGSIKPGDMVAIEKSLSQELQKDRGYGKMTSIKVSPDEIVLASDTQEFYYVPKELQKDSGNFTNILNNLKEYQTKLMGNEGIGADKPKLLKPSDKGLKNEELKLLIDLQKQYGENAIVFAKNNLGGIKYKTTIDEIKQSVDNMKKLGKSDDYIKEKLSQYDVLDKTKLLDEKIINNILDDSEYITKRKYTQPDKVFRGVGGQGVRGEGTGVAKFGEGLYTTPQMKNAKVYAGDKGEILRLGPDSTPKYPLVFNDFLDFENWLDYKVYKNLGLTKKQFEAKYPDIGVFIKQLGYDGLALGPKDDRYLVKFTNKTGITSK